MIIRPEVLTRVGEPIELPRLAPSETTPEKVRELSDLVMSRIVDLVEELRGEAAPSPVGVERRPD